jgi:hypothetical protein
VTCGGEHLGELGRGKIRRDEETKTLGNHPARLGPRPQVPSPKS